MLSFGFLTPQMDNNRHDPSFQGPWEKAMERRAEEILGGGRWWHHLVLPWLQLSLWGVEEAQIASVVNSQVTPGACDLFVKMEIISLMVPKPLSF